MTDKAFQRERETYTRGLDQFRKQIVQLATSLSTPHTDLSAIMAERDTSRRVAAESRHTVARQERTAADV
eukprot:11193107-Lingulodinium_polyedra.AAC.1